MKLTLYFKYRRGFRLCQRMWDGYEFTANSCQLPHTGDTKPVDRLFNGSGIVSYYHTGESRYPGRPNRVLFLDKQMGMKWWVNKRKRVLPTLQDYMTKYKKGTIAGIICFIILIIIWFVPFLFSLLSIPESFNSNTIILLILGMIISALISFFLGYSFYTNSHLLKYVSVCVIVIIILVRIVLLFYF